LNRGRNAARFQQVAKEFFQPRAINMRCELASLALAEPMRRHAALPAYQIHRNERGLPENPTITRLKGRWVLC
jgi:hypothetical protein